MEHEIPLFDDFMMNPWAKIINNHRKINQTHWFILIYQTEKHSATINGKNNKHVGPKNGDFSSAFEIG